MREIKFRVWDNQNDYWAKESEVIVSMGLEFGINDYFEKKNGADKCLRWCFQQYTGLKDTNGVEIYEGDIVEVNAINEDYDNTIYIGEIRYGSDNSKYRSDYPTSFIIYCKDFYKNEGLLFNSRFTIKVIGNIYQNKELLED